MSSDFRWGMACIPAVVALFAVAAVAVLGLIWASAQWDFGTYKLWPHKTQRETIAATVASAKAVRYLWIPGWHIVICRTTLFDRMDSAATKRHFKVRDAVRNALHDAA